MRLTPRARHDLIEGFTADAGTGGGATLAVRVTAPPLQDRANTALLRVLARALDVPVSSLRVAAGARSRRKLVAVEGMGSVEARARLDLTAARRLVPASSAERVPSAGSNPESKGALDGHDDAR